MAAKVKIKKLKHNKVGFWVKIPVIKLIAYKITQLNSAHNINCSVFKLLNKNKKNTLQKYINKISKVNDIFKN